VKRPFGVIFSAILLFLGSLFQLLMAVLMAFSGAWWERFPRLVCTAQPRPRRFPVDAGFMYGLSAFFVALAVWES